jgi:type II secretory pathway pseudopilin PulG
MCLANQDGFTFLMALFVVVIIGIMSALTGKSWTMIMKREREKELMFRGSQIKEAIENWYNPKYTVPGVQRSQIRPLMDLKDLLQYPNSLTPLRFLPQSYGSELEDKNPKCAPDCAKLKIYQDPMTGKEWTVIRGTIGPAPEYKVTPIPGTQGGIVGVASKSNDVAVKTDFKDTALESMVATGATTPPAGGNGTVPVIGTATDSSLGGAPASIPGTGAVAIKYSDWKFIADNKNNDHAKIYRAYHEGW